MKGRKDSNKPSAKRFKQYLPIPIEIVHYPCAVCNTEAITNAVECFDILVTIISSIYLVYSGSME